MIDTEEFAANRTVLRINLKSLGSIERYWRKLKPALTVAGVTW